MHPYIWTILQIKIKEKQYTQGGAWSLYFQDRDNIMASSGKFTHNSYNHSNNMANIMKA